MRINYHLHNRHSSDGRGGTDEVVRRAAELGYDQICFTNHAETLGDGDDWSLDLVEARARFEELQGEIEALRPEYPDLKILLGIEVEYRPEWVEPLEALVRSVPFDMVIGSVHVVDGHPISGGAVGPYFRDRDVEETYGRYFDVLAEMVEWGGFDVVGHFDLVKRFGVKHYGRQDFCIFEPRIRSVLERMADKGIGMEVNTSGVVQPPGEPYPGLEILKMARDARIATLTIGTDSHVPRSLDQGGDVGYELIRQVGFTELTLFSHRMRRNVPIDATPDASAAGG